MTSIHLGTHAANRGRSAITCERVFNSVLLVEDHLETAAKTRAILESRGLQVHTARDGGQVHLMMQLYRPACVVTEIVLPGESGFELTEWIKQRYQLPIVVLTDVDLPSARQLAQRVGVDAYVTKPVSAKTLLRVLDETARAVWEEKLSAEQAQERGQVSFQCRCGTQLEEQLANRGKYVTCSACNDRVLVPLLNRQEMLCVGSDSLDCEQNEQEQFWRVTMRYVTVKCQFCATYFRPFTSDKTTSKVCPKCEQEQTRPLCSSGAPLTRAAMESSLRVLRVFNGKHRGKQLMLPRHEVILGRDASCEIRRQNSGWSKRHCALRPSVEGVIVRDLGSARGTRIDGYLIRQETLLRPGGLLTVGDLWFQLVCANSSHKCDDSVITLRCPETSQMSVQPTEHETVFEFRDTAIESAKVIQEFWESCRQRAVAQLNARRKGNS
jgi:DNA-binding response OmpR family regulator/pSer/pThr/pTyr-binding forkhead associated (FHA) protein